CRIGEPPATAITVATLLGTYLAKRWRKQHRQKYNCGQRSKSKFDLSHFGLVLREIFRKLPCRRRYSSRAKGKIPLRKSKGSASISRLSPSPLGEDRERFYLLPIFQFFPLRERASLEQERS